MSLLLEERKPRLSASVRWALLCAVIVLGLAVAIWPRDQAQPPAPSAAAIGSAAADPAAEAAARNRADLPGCPAPSGRPAAGPLHGTTLDCLSDGRPVDLGAALAGRPVLLNVWAYWCEPCRAELPALAAYARRAGTSVTVLTVHADPNTTAGLDLLAELGVRLPTISDPRSVVATRIGAPRAYPVTALLRPDGTVAAVHARPFASADQFAAAVRTDLGIDS
jgi:thiol-disulfide isomerase/thioredoxin